MNKTLALLFIGLFIFSSVSATAPFETEQLISKQVVPSYCGPNDIQCNQPQIDVVFVVDSTGSMYDEIRTVKEELANIVKVANSGYPKPDIKLGVVTYRDYKPEEQEYLTRDLQLTEDKNKVLNFIENINANGGGDYEEAVEAGLDVAINDMNWRKDSLRMIILVGDAPARSRPYTIYDQHGNSPELKISYTWKDAVEDAIKQNIRIYTATGSGINDEGISQFKAIASQTGGSYINLIYERRVIDEYYAEKDIPVEYAAEARAAPDYDAKTDSVVTNNLGIFAKASIQKEAKAAGVSYEDPGMITGDIIAPTEKTTLTNFFQTIYQKIKFW